MKQNKYTILTLAFFSLLLISCNSSEKNARFTIYENALIYTSDDTLPVAQAMVVSDERIVYIGSDNGAHQFANEPIKVIDMHGKTILPSFIESHAHPTLVGALNFDKLLALSSDNNKEITLQKVREYYKANPQIDCIIGFGFLLESFNLSQGETPTREELDKITDQIPILLYDESLHSAWCNSKALEVANIDENTPDILPGISYYVRYPGTNIPSGYVYESAFSVAKHLPNITLANLYANILSVLRAYSQYGFTGIVDVDDYFEIGNEVLKQLQEENELPFYYQKAYIVHPTSSPIVNIHKLDSLNKKYTNDQLFYTICKLFLDGTIELETASLLEPYTSSGKVVEPLHTRNELYHHLFTSLNAGYAIHIHAIGDKAQQYALDAFESTKNISPFVTRTIAHNQSFEPNAAKKYGMLGNNYFCQSTPSWIIPYEDDPTILKLGNERFNNQFLWKQVIDEGGTLTLGSDYP
ncbi:MAG: amidohydrolase, partial [Phocaeicola sp.]